MRKPPKEATIKKLFALSGNRCAFPGCLIQLVDDKCHIVGQLCHIEAAEPGGPRYNGRQSDDERCSFENLILLCANHHLVTNDSAEYPVDVLRNMKADHEARFRDNPYLAKERVLQEVLRSWDRGQEFLHGGLGSQIVTQQGNVSIHQGVSTGDVLQLTQFVFDKNLPLLRTVAREEAQARIDVFKKMLKKTAKKRKNAPKDTSGISEADTLGKVKAPAEAAPRRISHYTAQSLAKLLARHSKLYGACLKILIVNDADEELPQLPIDQLTILVFDSEAIELLLDVMASLEQRTPLWDAVTEALKPLGAALVAPILTRLPTASSEYRRELWFLLAGSRVRDSRVLALLLAALEESPETGAKCLRQYGDPAALHHLSCALDAYGAGSGVDMRNASTVLALREAIEALGGVLTPSPRAPVRVPLWLADTRYLRGSRQGRRNAFFPADPLLKCPTAPSRGLTSRDTVTRQGLRRPRPSFQAPDQHQNARISMRLSKKPPSADDQDRPKASRACSPHVARDVGTDVVGELLLDPSSASPEVGERILALGEAAVEPLLAVLDDSKLRDPNDALSGQAPVLAAQLLGQLAAERVVEPLLDIFTSTDWTTSLHDAISKALTPFGAALVTPILARLPTAIGEYRRELWFLLAGSGVRDPRVLTRLLSLLTEAPEFGAICLCQYGDPAALPYLSRALDAHEFDPEADNRGDHTVFELREAILELGGVLTPSQQAKYKLALGARRREVAAMFVAA